VSANSDHLPEQFEPILHTVIAFANPVLTGEANGPTWAPEAEMGCSARRHSPAPPTVGAAQPPLN
jgi:hypothetical protein